MNTNGGQHQPTFHQLVTLMGICGKIKEVICSLWWKIALDRELGCLLKVWNWFFLSSSAFSEDVYEKDDEQQLAECALPQEKTVITIPSIKSSVPPKLQDHEYWRLRSNKEAVFPLFSFTATFCSAARQLRNQGLILGACEKRASWDQSEKAFFDLPS